MSLTQASVVRLTLPELEAIEVQRRMDAFELELNPSGEVSVALSRRAAVLSVRMERLVDYENATLTARVRRAEADFVAPEGVDVAEAACLRTEAGRLAAFDPSKEAILARRYEAAAERGFFRALKEFRLVERSIKAAAAEAEVVQGSTIEELASFLDDEGLIDEFDEFAASYPEEETMGSAKADRSFLRPEIGAFGGRVDVPMTIGRGR